MRVLVTGAAGFLGRHVFNLLAQSQIPVVGIDNYDPLCGAGLPMLPVIKADVRDFSDMEGVILGEKITHIMHLAAYGRNLTCQDHPLAAWDVNVTGTEVVLEAARRNKVHRVLVCSSNIVLSDQRTVYRSTKVAVEALVEAYSSLGVSVLGLRPSNIYGAGQSKTEYQMCAFAGLDSCYAKEGIFRISGDGTQTRDWVHASDVARAFVGSIGFFEATGMTIDIATGVQTSMNAIADMLGVPVVYEKPRLGDAKRLVSDTKRAHDFLMFDAEVPLKTGIWDAFPSLKKP